MKDSDIDKIRLINSYMSDRIAAINILKYDEPTTINEGSILKLIDNMDIAK